MATVFASTHPGYKASCVAQNADMLSLVWHKETDIMTEQQAVVAAEYVPFPEVTLDPEPDETSDVTAYVAALTGDDQAETVPAGVSLEAQIAAGAYTVLYTNNPLGVLPSTLVIDEHAGEYHGAVVRKLACPTANVGVQQASSRAGGTGREFFCFTELVWEGVAEDEAVNVAREAALLAKLGIAPTPTAPPAPEAPVVETPAPAPRVETPVVETPELLALRTAQAAATAAQAAADALQQQLAALQEQARLAQEAALAAKAMVPVEITPALRASLDAFNAIALLDEQGRAKAFMAGLVWLKAAGGVRKDSGTSGKIPKSPSSSGVVEVNRHGSLETAVSGTDKTMSEETRAFIRNVKTELVTLGKVLGKPWNLVKGHDRDIAAKLGFDVELGSKRIWNIRNGKHAEVHADIR